MNEEVGINIFAFSSETDVFALGFTLYSVSGTDSEIAHFLRSRVAEDHRDASVAFLTCPIPSLTFRTQVRQQLIQSYVLDFLDLPERTPYCLTTIIDNEPRIEEIDDESSKLPVSDYLDKYGPLESFDFDQLIEDDLWSSVRLLWNEEKYTSVLKLVFPMIDTLAFVDLAADLPRAFHNWIDEYCDMLWMGITAEELWELRNSVIHMTNADSRKVREGKVERLLPVVAHPMVDLPQRMEGIKVFHEGRFVLSVLPMGIQRWIESYKKDPSKVHRFIMAYDTVLSDSRYTRVPTNPQEVSFQMIEDNS